MLLVWSYSQEVRYQLTQGDREACFYSGRIVVWRRESKVGRSVIVDVEKVGIVDVTAVGI